MSEYDAWAVYYDFIHTGLSGETEYYVEAALEGGGEILELGCGTGRICIPMAMCGGRVSGLELSAEMLLICREKAQEVAPFSGRLDLVQGDMRAIPFKKRFASIVMPYRTFMHLLTPADQLACLQDIYAHLEEGGLFLMNTWAARPKAIVEAAAFSEGAAFKESGCYALPDSELRLVHSYRAHFDDARQWIEETHRVEEVDLEDRVLHREDLALLRAWTTPREMEHLIARAGFQVEAQLGSFYGDPFEASSSEMIWRLRK